MMQKIINAFFPPVCVICGKLNENYLCNKCKSKIKDNCVCNIEDYNGTLCYFDKHIYLCYYRGEFRKILLDYKFNEKSYIYEGFINILKNNKKVFVQLKKYDIIIPVPISKKRFKKRGYNQSALFARKVANTLDMIYKEKVLIKIKENKVQSTIGQEERKNNVLGVYSVINSKQIYNKKILLVDDIFTTGSTANECAKVLINNNAKKVGVLTIAKD